MGAQHLPPGLVRELRQGQVAVFVGAGTSIEAGLPTWTELVDHLAEDLGLLDASAGGKVRYSQLSAVPQYYENRFGRKSLTERIRDLLPRKGVRPSVSHQLLADLPCDLFYTTNFDVLLEAALEASGRDFATISTEEDAKDHSGRDQCQVRKIHGSIDTANSLVITRDDFLRYDARHPHISERLRTDLATTTFLFVGYSLDDPDFSLLYDRVFLALAPFERRHYITVFDANEHQVEDLRRRGLEVIKLNDWNDSASVAHDGLQTFLRQLCEATSDAVHLRKIFCSIERGQDVPVVVPSYIHPEEKYEFFPRMDFNVARSLEQALSLLGATSEIYADADVIRGDPDAFLRQNLILVGSPRGNKLSEYVFETKAQIFQDRDVSVTFEAGETRALLVGKGEQVERFEGRDPAKSSDPGQHVEYAVVARYANPWNARTNLWLMAGLWGLGTQALADVIATGRFRELDWPPDGDAAVVLRIPYTYAGINKATRSYDGIEIAAQFISGRVTA